MISPRSVAPVGSLLLIEMPLGILLALAMPKRGWGVSACLVLMSLPLLIPWNTIGTIWIIFTRPDIGLFGAFINKFVDFDHTARPLDAWVTVMLMEVWHWTPLVTLLAYAGLQAIPDAYYQAARIDAASPWSTFWYIQLPKMRGVLTIGGAGGTVDLSLCAIADQARYKPANVGDLASVDEIVNA